MKILYIASERSRAQVATRALRSISPSVTVLWGSNFERAAFSILENPDLAALIVEVQSDSHGCSYLKQIGTLGVQAPVVMVLPDGAGSPIESLKAGAAYYVAKGVSFSQELPAVVARAIGGEQAPVVPRSDDSSHPRETARRVSDVEPSFQQPEQRRAAEPSAAAGRQAKLEMLLQQERELRTGIEQKLAEAKAAFEDAEHRQLSATSVATATLAERRRHYETGMARATATQEMLEEQLRQSRQSQASAVAEGERLTRHNAELSSLLTQATATGKTLEGRLAHLETALDVANERASRHPSAAAGRQDAAREAELQAQLEQEFEKRRNLEEELARAKRAHHEAEQQQSSVVTAATALWTERQGRFEAELAAAVEAGNTLGRDVRELEAARDQSGQTLQAHAADVERLTQREAELSSQLAEAAALRSTLERQLIDAVDALKAASEGASQNRLTAATKAAERELEFEGLVHHERAVRADVEQRLAQLEASLREAEQQHASAVTAAATRIDRLTQREADLTSQLADTATMRSALEGQLSDAAKALKDAKESAGRDRLSAETKAAEGEAEFDRLIRDERATHDDLEQRLAQVEGVLRDVARKQSDAETALAAARRDHAAASAEVQRLTQREAALASQVAEAATTRSALERQLTDAAEALKEAQEGAKRDRAAAEGRAAAREVEFERLVGDERTIRADVEQRLALVDSALREAERKHTLAMNAAATERAERQAQFDAELSQTAATRDEFQRRFSDAETAVAAARHDHAAAATEVDRLTQRGAALTAQVTQIETALRDAEQTHAVAMSAAATERAERQAQFDAELSQTAATRDEFQRRFSDAETALAAARHDHAAAATEVDRLTQREAELTAQVTQSETAFREAEQTHAVAMTAAATERAERQAQFDAELSQTAATRDEFKRRFSDAETAVAAARHDHAAAATEVERLTQRGAVLTSQLADAATRRSALERQLTNGAEALKGAEESARQDRVAAETRAGEREAEFQRLIGRERTSRADVEQRLAQEIARREALDHTVVEMRSAAADAEQRFREDIAALTTRSRDEATRLENQFATEREKVREQSRRQEIDFQNERDGLERTCLTAETEVRRLAAELTETRQNLDEARKEFQQTLDRVTGEHADSLAKLVVEGAERDARIEDLEKQLDEGRRELRRQFQHAPLALWRCTRDGGLIDANRALAQLVGYRESDELHGVDFVNTVFESTDDLSWLIERCLSTKTRQSVETAWKERNGERLVVRLSAVEFAPDTIEIAVEDVTNLCVLEDRLAQAHRMEAVARLASEIAITCGRLLRDVHEDGQQWLLTVTDGTSIRKRGERLLGEVARAASYLERLTAHDDEQTSALKPVELNRVLRDLKPVLKHVAGDDVDLELSKTSSPLNVDMKADRVERLLVNLASYGRERMPVGGRLRIELATVVVDQKFIADHPNVRRGHHALITVTAMRRTMGTTATLETSANEPNTNELVSEKPGVDLGALQELLRECGGHLWLTVEPPGNMVVKIRLPLRVWDDRPQPTTSDSPTSRKRGTVDSPTSQKRVMSRWFRH
jgi:PAS domain S-box-containing protein